MCKIEGNALVKNPKAKIIKFYSAMCSECKEQTTELNKAMAELDAASRRVSKMRDYLEDAIDEATSAHEELKNIETEMRE